MRDEDQEALDPAWNTIKQDKDPSAQRKMRQLEKKMRDGHYLYDVPRKRTRGWMAYNWIESYCVFPSGPDKGELVILTRQERDTINLCYNTEDGLEKYASSIDGPLAAYLVLPHVVGREAVKTVPPQFQTDISTVWASIDPYMLLPHVQRQGESIVSPDLGTRWQLR